MELTFVKTESNLMIFTLPAASFIPSLPESLLNPYLIIILSLLFSFFSLGLLTWAFSSSGKTKRNPRSRFVPVPGPRGLPVFGSLFTLSRGLPHRTLAFMAWTRANTQLMAFTLGSTPLVVSSDPHIAREILTSPHFANRPIKQSAKSLMFTRAIGFAPNGTYWRLLRKISSSHLFSPRRIIAHEANRQLECATMLGDIAKEQELHQTVGLRKHLQTASLNNIMASVFGRRYGPTNDKKDLDELRDMVNEGFDLLGAFNWSDYLPWLSYLYDPFRINERCFKLVPRVRAFVRGIINEHRQRRPEMVSDYHNIDEGADFVDVLLSLDGEDKLLEDDMIAVLWEMIFRGTDTTALLTEWVMAELILHKEIQKKLRNEIDSAVGIHRNVTDADVAKMPYLQAIIKETLRIHPPGPLLSWARLSTSEVELSNGMHIPANTTAMVNMWAITHDPSVWEDPHEFIPERFFNADVDVRGGDLRLAPFGAGRRVCPGKNLGLVTVGLWVAKLVQHFKWVQDLGNPVDMSEVLKLSCEMKYPLHAKPSRVVLSRNS